SGRYNPCPKLVELNTVEKRNSLGDCPVFQTKVSWVCVAVLASHLVFCRFEDILLGIELRQSSQRRRMRSTQFFGGVVLKPSTIQISKGHLAMDVRKRLPSGCRLNPATLSVEAGRSTGARNFSAPVFTFTE